MLLLPHRFKDVIWNFFHGDLKILKMQQRSSIQWQSWLWTTWGVSCVWLTSQPHLCHLHGNTFRKIPFNVLQVNLCCAACNVTQLQKNNKKHFDKSLIIHERTEKIYLIVWLSWFTCYLIIKTAQTPVLDPHLNASVMRSHLVLDPVFFKDVDWFKKCEPFYVLLRFITGREKNPIKINKRCNATWMLHC